MPYQKTIIPRGIKSFNNYLIVTNAYLILGVPITNAVRLGWSVADLAFWQGLQTQWSPLYLQWIDKKGAYTTDIKNDLMNIIAQAVAYDKKNKLILKVKATPDLTSEDCSTFNLPQKLATIVTGAKPFATPHVAGKTAVTSEAVYPKLVPQTGGFLKVECFTDKVKSGRAHKLAGFDEVEYAIGVFISGTANTPLQPTDAKLTSDYSSKAEFIIDTTKLTNNLPVVTPGTLQPAKMAVLFFRWAKSKHPGLDGPWSGPFITPLL